MPIITIQIAQELNISLQRGDTIYYSRLQNNQAGKNTLNPTVDTNVEKLGVVTNVNRPSRVFTVDTGATLPNLQPHHYLMFSKDRRANISGITGYYMLSEFRNASTLPAEIFTVSTDYVLSSK